VGEAIEVVVSSEAFVRWAREVTEAAERLRILLDNMPRRMEITRQGRCFQCSTSGSKT